MQENFLFDETESPPTPGVTLTFVLIFCAYGPLH